MSNLMVKDMQDEAVERLEGMAEGHGRSLQEELRMILEAVAGTVSPEALRGWGQMLPVPGGEDADALARLEAVMAADPSPAAPLRSWTGRDDEPDSVEQLLHYMEATWQPGQFHAV